MRSLFIVVCKVYGLMQVYTGLTYIFMVIPTLHILAQRSDSLDAETTTVASFHGEQITLTAISLGSMVILTFGIAWVLILRTRWLADRLHIPDSDASQSPSVEILLHAGTKLIGLFLVVQSIPLLAQGLFQIRHMLSFEPYMWSTITLPVIRLLIGLSLVFKTQLIVNFIMTKKGQNKTLDDTSQ
jgi:hypothetical protein